MFAITPRLLLRPPWPEDAPALREAADDVRIARNVARLPSPYSLGDAERYCTSAAAAVLPSLLIVDRKAERPRLIGTCGLGEREGDVELGYWIRHDSWNRGYASEAGKALVAMARALGHGRLSAGHFIDNPASGAVLYKLGFRETGRIEPRWSEGRQAHAPSCRFVLSVADDAQGDSPGARCTDEPAAA